MNYLRVIFTVGLVALSLVSQAEAQYFGRNKVEHIDFEFHVLRTDHFDVYYYAREERAARIAAQLAERWYARFSEFLQHELGGRQPLILYGSQPEFAQTNVVSGLLSDTVGGVTESAKRRIAIPFAPTLSETNRVLGHEIAHAFQFDIARRQGGGLAQPLWFIEGMAEYLARGATDAEASLWIRDIVLSERLPLRQRDAARRLSPYQYGHAFWTYLTGRFGDEVITKILKPSKKRSSLTTRIQEATGTNLDLLFSEWRAAVSSIYASDREAGGEDTAWLGDGGAGRIQLGPALSPDGRQAVFFSERDRLALDLVLADVKTGRIVRKLATTTASARFDSLQPLRSAGAWKRSGDQFGFAVVRQGHAALVLLDMTHPGKDREIQFEQLGQILTFSWSPDGRSLALSALADGFTNLYIYDLVGHTLKQLTDDPYADLHPAWSPNGHEVAFVTDRYSTDLALLEFGQSTLAVIDVETKAVRSVPVPLHAAELINPQWSVDGRDLYFVGNPGDTSNVYRFDQVDRVLYQVTQVRTGVNGLTPTSPSLSAATQAPVLAFTIYQGGRHRLAVLDDPLKLSGEAVAQPDTIQVETNPSGRVDPRSRTLEGLLANSRTGLPDASTLHVSDYAPRLSLERIGQPYLSSGGGALGTFVRAGGSLLFGDMLAERRLGAALQIGNRLRDVAFETRFLNQAHRLNWGAIAQLEPALRRYRFSQSIEHDGQPALMKQADYLQRMQLRLAGLLAYPFSRWLRVEFTGGFRHARYHRDVRSRVSSVETGRILEEARVESSGGDPTTVIELGTALVGDTTAFGLTGPILGSRYRLEFTPAVGDLTYTSILADYRKYVMPVKPYTMAVRLLHSGRFGRDGDDQRLLPSFLGSRYFVRGHGWDARDCQPDPVTGCGGELLGSRLVVANLELRVPVRGIFSRQLEYGPLPMDAFVFADGGLVWSRNTDATQRARGFLGSAPMRRVISSVGLGVRLNAGGMPFELSAVRTLDGPSTGWSADFGFRTGF